MSNAMADPNAAASRRVFVAGHRGMVGSAIVRALEATGGYETVTRTRVRFPFVNRLNP